MGFFKILKIVTNPVGALIDKVVDKSISNETAKDIIKLCTAGFGDPIVGTVDLLDHYQVIDTSGGQDVIDTHFVDKKGAGLGELLNGFEWIDSKGWNVVANADGTVYYSAVKSLMGIFAEGVLCQSWGKAAKILSIEVLGNNGAKYTKDNSTYAIPFVIALWNKQNISVAKNVNIFDYLNAVTSPAQFRRYSFTDMPNDIFINLRSVNTVTGEVQPIVSKRYKNPIDFYTDKTTFKKNTNGAIIGTECNYKLDYDYILDRTGKIKTDNTKPSNLGVEDMFYLTK